MRILLTGAGGQLGQAFREVAAGRHDVVPAFHAPPAGAEGVTLDLEDAEAPARVVAQTRPDWVVHGAAMTNVDGCEREPDKARLVNALATGRLAQACREHGARLVYVSTDYVFDGARGGYREDDAPNPIQTYGASKLEGERLAQESLPDVAIARTSVVYGPHKNNFVLWLLGELRAGRRVRIVDDQRVSPTLTHDLAAQVLALIDARATGIYHTAGATALDRLTLARQIARAFDADESLIDPIRSTDLSWLAKRPMDSTLDVTRISRHARPLPLDEALATLKKHLEART